jgi:hypothetical protein
MAFGNGAVFYHLKGDARERIGIQTVDPYALDASDEVATARSDWIAERSPGLASDDR